MAEKNLKGCLLTTISGVVDRIPEVLAGLQRLPWSNRVLREAGENAIKDLVQSRMGSQHPQESATELSVIGNGSRKAYELLHSWVSWVLVSCC